jgi:hypothetical protein
MAPVVVACTGTVVTVKVPVFAPAAIVILSGTVAAPLAEDNAITAPPGGAFPFRVAVPAELLPPTRVAGLKLIDDSEAGVTV